MSGPDMSECPKCHELIPVDEKCDCADKPSDRLEELRIRVLEMSEILPNFANEVELLEELFTTIEQQQRALVLGEEALKIEAESLAGVIEIITDKDSEVPNVWTNRLKKVQAAIKAIEEPKIKSHHKPDLSQGPK